MRGISDRDVGGNANDPEEPPPVEARRLRGLGLGISSDFDLTYSRIKS